MASETVDPIDWSHPPPYTGQYPLSSTFCTVQCGLQITRLAALCEPRTCDLQKARPTHCLCGGSEYNLCIHICMHIGYRIIEDKMTKGSPNISRTALNLNPDDYQKFKYHRNVQKSHICIPTPPRLATTIMWE